MTVKVIAMLTRKAGLSESGVRRLLREPATRHSSCRSRRRSAITGATICTAKARSSRQDARLPDFDVVTELWFDDQAAFDAAMVAFTDPANAARIARDEENVFDRSRTMFFVATERGGGRQHGRQS